MNDLSGTVGRPFRHGSASEPLLDLTVQAGVPDVLDKLVEAADPAHLFLRAAWFRAASAPRLQTLVATRANGAPTAALPLEKRSFLLRAVPGSYWPTRSFPISADTRDAELTALLTAPTAKRALGPVWRLGPVRADDPTASRLIPAAGAAGWAVLTRTLGTAFVLDLTTLRAEACWPKSSTLKKNRYFERKLAEQGDLEFRHHCASEWTPELFDTLAEIERSSWIASKTDASDAKFLAPTHRVFWERAVADPVLASRMHASVLTVGGTPAAFAFYVEAGSTIHLIANTFHERFRQQSPGRLLLYRDFQRLIAEGQVDRIDWGAGDPGYKSDMGAAPGPAILDHLFVRNRLVARLLRPLWRS